MPSETYTEDRDTTRVPSTEEPNEAATHPPTHPKGIAAKSTSLTDEQFLASLRQNGAYTGIDLHRELAKMDAWLTANPQRKKTRRFVVNWLNRAATDRPLTLGPPPTSRRRINDAWKQTEPPPPATT